jgi:signal transduction histidine kinase/CheY-like chemotaxis protein/methyl-accepting chemotaxis protein
MQSKKSVTEILKRDMNQSTNFILENLKTSDTVMKSILEEIADKNLNIARAIAEIVKNTDNSLLTPEKMAYYSLQFEVDEIYITDENGVTVITNGVNGFDFKSSEQSNVFVIANIYEQTELVQPPMPRGHDNEMYQYIGVPRLDSPGIVQIGLTISSLTQIVDSLSLNKFIDNYVVGINGGVFVLDKVTGENLQSSSLVNDSNNSYFTSEILKLSETISYDGETYYFVYNFYEDKIIACYIPETDIFDSYIGNVYSQIITGIVAVVISWIVSFFSLSIFLIKPLEVLNEEINSLQNNKKIKNPIFKRNREIYNLSNSINLMLSNIDRRDELVSALTIVQEDLESKLKEQELISIISKVFSSSSDLNSNINKSLELTLNFLNVSRILITTIDPVEDYSYVTNVVTSDVSIVTDDKTSGLKQVLVSTFPSTNEDVDNVPSISCSDVRESEKYSIFQKVGVIAFLWSPLYVNNSFYGVIAVEDTFNAKNWSNADKLFISLLSNTISNAIGKNIYENERDRALDEAKKSSSAKTEFLAKMSHEMRTPLNAIVGMTNIGLKQETAEKKDESFAKIIGASRHLLGVINDVLDMSKIEANKMELSNVSFNLNELVLRIENVMRYRFEEKHQNLVFEIDDKIPSSLFGDDQRFSQVCINLLSNANKFTPANGKVTFNLELSSLINDIVRVKGFVLDTGIGIKESEAIKLFNPFVQADSSTTRKYGGTGLGLVISKKITELMNGDIRIESKIGEGSKFIFEVEFKLIEETKKIDEDDSSIFDSDFSDYRILLVEDVDINREIVRSLLESTNIKIDEVENGFLAIEKFKEEKGKYDLIFMDLQMPIMDGITSAKEIRKLPIGKKIPIVAMTANVFKEDIDKCFQAGMNDHIGKPIDLKELFTKLAFFLNKK